MSTIAEESASPSQGAPRIISEVRLDFGELMKTNNNIVAMILDSSGTVFEKAGLLERLLPNLAAGDNCSCSCSCSCSCMCSCKFTVLLAGRL